MHSPFQVLKSFITRPAGKSVQSEGTHYLAVAVRAIAMGYLAGLFDRLFDPSLLGIFLFAYAAYCHHVFLLMLMANRYGLPICGMAVCFHGHIAISPFLPLFQGQNLFREHLAAVGII